MLAAVEASMPADIFIGAAAVADWRVENSGAQKIKKSLSSSPFLQLSENPDILAQVSAKTINRPKLVIGFAAETEKVIAYAQDKLARKKYETLSAQR